MAQKKEVNRTSQFGTYALMLAIAVFLALVIYAGVSGPSTDKAMGSASIGFAIGIIIGIMVAVFIIAWRWSKGEPIIPEKERIILCPALSCSFLFSAALIAMLILINQLKLAALNVNSVLMIVYFGMMGPVALSWFYFSRKGDLG